MTTQADQAPKGRTGPEFPTEHQLRVYGDFLFLGTRSAHHRNMPLENFRAAIEPPIALGQYRVFRWDDVPRALFTWARLGPEAEARFVSGHRLNPQDWRSGDHLWLIDLIAPYPGLIGQLARWIMEPGNFTDSDYYFRRVSDGNRTRKVLHVDVTRTTGKATILQNSDFAI